MDADLRAFIEARLTPTSGIIAIEISETEVHIDVSDIPGPIQLIVLEDNAEYNELARLLRGRHIFNKVTNCHDFTLIAINQWDISKGIPPLNAKWGGWGGIIPQP